MDSKVTVIGFTGSGKTTYLTGMYICMSGGVKHFSLLAKDKDMDLYLENLWDMICDGKKPKGTDKSECYDFHIAHNFKPVCDFKWLDYPGGILADPNHQERSRLESDIKESDCLLLIIDGELLAGIDAVDADSYREQLENKLRMNNSIRKEYKMFTELSKSKTKIEHVGIVVTKCDLIDSQLEEKDIQSAIQSAIRNRFEGLFEEPERVVLQMSVSLGGPIEEGFMPEPFCVEQPIAFAVLTILLKYIEEIQKVRKELLQFISKHNGIFDRKKVEEAREKIKNLEAALDKWSKDAFTLIDIFSDKKTIYVGGIEKNLKDYYKNEFRKLTD